MDTKHTPGPWNVLKSRFEIAGSIRTCIGIEGTSSYGAHKTIAICTGWEGGKTGDERPTEEQIANARLIESAPDLLEALKDLSEWGRTHTSPSDPNSPHDLLVAAVAAIEKATTTNAEYLNAVMNRDGWLKRAESGAHPGRGFCLEQAENWNRTAEKLQNHE